MRREVLLLRRRRASILRQRELTDGASDKFPVGKSS